ncbi:MAG: hypothetical protein GF350_03895 [Chitinivibrionales bacterium]|nr:hypothetical protein [Chitinivibrionales bacterium]
MDCTVQGKYLVDEFAEDTGILAGPSCNSLPPGQCGCTMRAGIHAMRVRYGACIGFLKSAFHSLPGRTKGTWQGFAPEFPEGGLE